MPSPLILLLLLCLFAPRAEALVDYVVDNFLTDFSGSPADLVGIDPALGDTIKMAPKERKYVLQQPVFLTDSSTSENGQAGTTPIVQSVSPGVFQVGYVSWPTFHVTKHADDLTYPLAHIVSRKVVLEEGKTTIERAVKLAGFENRPDQFGAGQSPNRSPTYFSYLAEGSRYMAFWGSMDPGAYIRWTNSEVPAGGGDGNTWGKYLFEAPNDPVNVPGYGELGAALVPGTGGKEAVIAYEHVIDPGFNHQNEVRWIDLDDYPNSTRVRFTRNPNYGEDFVAAADSAGRVLVMWRENQTIWATVYSSAQVAVVPPTLIKAGVHVQDGVVPHFFRPYAAVNLARGLFAIAYTVGGQLEYRYLTVSGGSPAVAGSATLTVGPATTVTRPLDVARYPSLAVSNYRLVILYYNKQTADTDSLKARIVGLDGSFGIRPSPDTTDPPATPDVTDITLSYELVSFNAVGSGWYKCCHYYRAPSVAVDPEGHIALAYDNQFHSKFSLYSNSPIFHETASFTSRAVPITSLPTALPFDAALDSVEYEDYRAVVRNSSGGPPVSNLLLAVSADGSFTDPGSEFGAFPFGRRMPAGAFKYRVLLQANPPAFTTYTRVDSLILRYNVKPRKPVIDSLRIGTAPMAAYDTLLSYSVLPRKDSVHLVLSGVDIDDGAPVKFHLFSGSRMLDSATSSKTSPGRYRTVISFKPPDSLPDPMQLSVRVKDDSGWSSLPVVFRPAFRNLAPTETVTVTRRRGADSGGVFRPRGGGDETLAPAPGGLLVLQLGDTAVARLRLGDGNDDSVRFRLRRNNGIETDRRVSVRDPLAMPLAADTLPPLVDTVVAEVTDPDTTVTFRFLLRPNRLPALDSLELAGYKTRDSTARRGAFDRVRSPLDSGLVVPSGLPAVLRAAFTDADSALGDGVKVEWSVYAAKAGCAAGDLACYDRVLQRAGDSLAHAFALPQEYAVIRVTDSTGAFRERRIKLEYPVIGRDSTGAFAASLEALQKDLDFVLGSGFTADTLKAELASTGNIPLQVLSVATGRNDRKWLDLKLEWEAPGNPSRKDSLRVRGRTDVNPLAAGNPIAVAPGAKLTVTFRVDIDSLRGDSVIVDTLVLETNDLANPYIRIPIRMAYNDLPVLRISHLGGIPGPAGGYNDEGLPSLLPVRSRLVFAFSETVRVPDPGRRIRVYSWLDSLKNPSGYRNIPGTFASLRKAPKVSAGSPAAADSLADTLVFRPAYERPSDSLKVMPAPGAFIHRDILHIAVDNAVTDRTGNALDLRLDRRALAPGVLDTVFSVRVDTGFFRVVTTVPAAGAANWNPDDPIKVTFNRKLSLPPPLGRDSLTRLDLRSLKGDSNQGLWFRSYARGERRYDLQFLAVTDGDSSLLIRPKPRFAAFDTVTMSIGAGILDIGGLTLDGNRDGFPSAFYDTADTTDDYRFTFSTRDQEFYVFPNPFRHGDRRHQEKGTITFKNINSLAGYMAGREVVLRIHAMDGSLVYSSSTSRRITPAMRNFGTLEWDLRNNAGNLAGTGVYLYTLVSGGTAVLRKGKVAVIR